MDDFRFRLRLHFGDRLMLGPGKADLLELIDREGSISAAGRRMGMSYKRAWGLVEEMNAAFEDPVVESSRGGTSGGGARLTEAGRTILDHYRHLTALVEKSGAEDIAAIRRRLKDMSGKK